ncbi:MAG: ABC transporter ATP-binding protein [Pseudomonadota bacterium]
MKLLAFIWGYLPPHRARFILAQALSALEGLLVAMPAFAVALGLLRLAEAQAAGAALGVMDMAPYAAAVVAAVAMRLAVIRVSWRQSSLAGNAAGEQVRNAVLDHLRLAPLGVLAGAWSSARLSTLITEDGRWITDAAAIFIGVLLAGVVTTLALIGFIAFYDGVAALTVIAAFAGSIVFMVLLGPVHKTFIRKRNASMTEATQRIGEYADGVAVFRAFGRTGAAKSAFKDAVDRLHDVTIGVAPALVPLHQGGAAVIAFAAPLAVTVLATLAIGGRAVDTGLAISALILCLAAATAFSGGVLMPLLPLNPADRGRINVEEFLATPRLSGTATEFGPRFDIRFEGVGFRYAPDKPEAVSGVDLTVEHGTSTALVGPSGAGKSTLVALLMRFHDATTGRITVGGVDIAKADPSALQAQISLVSQDVHLFKDTLRANLLLGDPNASEARLREVVASARLEDLVAALPQGLETVLGDTGRTLSGGERQRVAIARALLKDAPILVFDEATSAMDPLTEHAIQEAVAALEKGRTVISIAHRLRSIAGSEQIAAIDGGRIVERGRHAQLLAQNGVQNGVYARLWRAQEDAAGWRLR